MEWSLVPITGFVVIGFIVWTVFTFRFRSRSRAAEVIEHLIEKGEPLTPELVKSVSLPPKSPHSDLRWGLIFVAIALGFIIFGQSIDDDEAPQIMAGIAAFPGMIGLSFLAFWGLVSRKTGT